MGRIRTIKPEFPQSESMGRLSRDARLLFIQLWTVVDDAGRTRAASRMLASLLYPYDDDAPSLIDGWLDELEEQHCIRRYEVGGDRYLEICNWLKHQKIDRPSKSRLPAFDEGSRAFVEASTTDLGPGPRTSTKDQEERSLRSLARENDVSRGTPKKSKRPNKLPLPPDWQPSPMHYAAGERLALSREAVVSRAEDMRIWAASNDVRKASWDATFHGFLRRAANEGPRNGQGRPRPLQDDTKSVSRAVDRLAGAMAEGVVSFAPRPSLLPSEGEGDMRLLPPGRSTGP